MAALAVLAVSAAAQQATDPPRAGSLVPRALRMPDYRWIRRTTPRAEIYIRAGSRSERIASSIPRLAEQAIDADLARLGVPFSGPPLKLFFVGSREEMRPLLGATPGGHSATDEGAAFFIGNDSIPPAMRHEIMHLLSWRLWGTPASAWLSEGLATSAAGRCGGDKHTDDDIAAILLREHRLVPLDTLWNHFIYSAEVGAQYYLQSASLIQYVDRRFGHEKLRALWPVGAYRDIRKRLGVDLATLERDWRASLAARNPKGTWTEVFAELTRRGCE